MDKFIYLVSPDYLRPIIKESAGYSFKIKGFDNCRLAYDNLYKTNQSSVLGFLLVYEELPEDCTDIVEFINFINLVGDSSVCLLLCVNNKEHLDDLLGYLEYDRINFMTLSEYDSMSDKVIKRDLFGSILLKNYAPYLDSEVAPRKINITSNTNTIISPVLPESILLILSPINKLSDWEHTKLHDTVLLENSDNSLLCYLRLCRIKRLFTDDIDYEGMVHRVSLEDNINKTIYKTVCDMIKDGY